MYLFSYIMGRTKVPRAIPKCDFVAKCEFDLFSFYKHSAYSTYTYLGPHHLILFSSLDRDSFYSFVKPEILNFQPEYFSFYFSGPEIFSEQDFLLNWIAPPSPLISRILDGLPLTNPLLSTLLYQPVSVPVIRLRRLKSSLPFQCSGYFC